MPEFKPTCAGDGSNATPTATPTINTIMNASQSPTANVKE